MWHCLMDIWLIGAGAGIAMLRRKNSGKFYLAACKHQVNDLFFANYCRLIGYQANAFSEESSVVTIRDNF